MKKLLLASLVAGLNVLAVAALPAHTEAELQRLDSEHQTLTRQRDEHNRRIAENRAKRAHKEAEGHRQHLSSQHGQAERSHHVKHSQNA